MRGPEVLALINHVGAQLLPVRKARNPYLCTQNPNPTDMTNSMKDHLPQIEMAKMEALYQIEAQYESGRLTLEEARRQLAERVGRLRPYHLAYMEQNLKSGDADECIRVDMRKTMQLLDGFMDNSRPSLPADHPLTHYYSENEEMRRLLLAVEDLVQYPMIKNQWLELYDRLKLYPIHYARKQNQLYPLLEHKGFDRPTTTMWNFDDIVRDEIRRSQQLLAGDTPEEDFIALQQELVAHCRDLMEKEETILYPTALALITPAEFDDMKSGDQEIGFAFITVAPAPAATPSTTPADGAAPTPDGLARDLQALLGKYGYAAGGDTQLLDVATGKLSLEQVNLIYQHLPVDISFVDENELVKFYSDTDHRIFPRSRNVIGRKVENCHPRKSVHVVKEIVAKFRSGEQDKAEFWINKPGLFIYIVYVAVRDKEGRFRGVLEMMQDCTRIREMQGSQTLLTWGHGEAGTAADPAPSAADTAASGPADTASGPEDAGTCPEDTAGNDMEITGSTRLKTLFGRYPNLKKNLVAAVPQFKMLDSPLGKLMLQRVTVGMAAERSGLGEDKLIELIRESLR